ncbi:MAG: hypothetical protein ACC662_02175, partial [Planctomycetota bacterium]
EAGAGAGNASVEGEGAVYEGGPPRLDEGKGLLLVLTDAELVDDTAIWYAQRLGPAYAGGYQLVQNLIDWATGSEDLLSLRAKARKPRLIEETDAKAQKLVTWLNIVGMPILVLLIGILVFVVRRYQR